MTEREKRDLGMLYDPGCDPSLLNELVACKQACHSYNQLDPTNRAVRDAQLHRIVGKVGERVTVLPPFWCDYGSNITMGDDFFANHGLTILDGARVTFGHHVFVGPDCGFYTACHPINIPARNAGLEYGKPITVGDNVWFGGGVKVLGGVRIGSNVVIGAGSVVTKDIPDNVIAMGNPCRVYREVSEEELFGENRE